MNYIFTRIHEKINKAVEYFKSNKNDPYEGMKISEKIILRNMFVSESVDDYLSGKRSIKRKFTLLILQFCIWISLLKSLLNSRYNNKTLLLLTGDYSYLHPRPDILNLASFSVFLPLAIVGENNQFIIIYSFVEKVSNIISLKI